jgi:hypothetical protein
MPKINELEGTKRIHEQPWGVEISIIALTDWGEEGDSDRSWEASCNGHLVMSVQKMAR